MSTQIPSYVWENCQIILKRIKDGKNQVEDFRQSNSYRELLGIDGQPIEFEWHIFPRTSLEILQIIQNDMQDQNNEPEYFKDRIIFMLFQIPNKSRSTRKYSREDTDTENGIPQPHKWWNDSKKVNQYSRASVL